MVTPAVEEVHPLPNPLAMPPRPSEAQRNPNLANTIALIEVAVERWREPIDDAGNETWVGDLVEAVGSLRVDFEEGAAARRADEADMRHGDTDGERCTACRGPLTFGRKYFNLQTDEVICCACWDSRDVAGNPSADLRMIQCVLCQATMDLRPLDDERVWMNGDPECQHYNAVEEAPCDVCKERFAIVDFTSGNLRIGRRICSGCFDTNDSVEEYIGDGNAECPECGEPLKAVTSSDALGRVLCLPCADRIALANLPAGHLNE